MLMRQHVPNSSPLRIMPPHQIQQQQMAGDCILLLKQSQATLDRTNMIRLMVPPLRVEHRKTYRPPPRKPRQQPAIRRICKKYQPYRCLLLCSPLLGLGEATAAGLVRQRVRCPLPANGRYAFLRNQSPDIRPRTGRRRKDDMAATDEGFWASSP